MSIRRWSIEDIQKLVAGYYRVTPEALVGNRRYQHIVIARHMAMYLCYDRLCYTQKEIARRFGGRDHSTVTHAIKATEDRIDTEGFIRDDLSHLVREIEAAPAGAEG